MGNQNSTTAPPLRASAIQKTTDLKYKELFKKYSKDNIMTNESLQELFQPLKEGADIFCLYTPNGFRENEFLILMNNFFNIYNDEQQLIFYLKFISNSKDLNLLISDLNLLINICCKASFLFIDYNVKSESKFFDSILKTFRDNITTENVINSFKRNIPNLTRDLHIHVSNSFNQLSHLNNISKNGFELVQFIESGKSLLTMEGLWLIYSFVPYSYIPFVAVSSTPPIIEIIIQKSWNCLYQSNQDGLSLNRLISVISSYKSASLFFISFDKYLICIGNDMEWRENKDKIGGPESFILRLYPDYSLVLVGSQIIYYNFVNKSLPRGIHIGSNPKSLVLKIDEDLSFVEYFGVKYPIHIIEVWGCGGIKAQENLNKQKRWEKNEALKAQNKKLNLENWEDSPDKIILGYAGIETKHNEREE